MKSCERGKAVNAAPVEGGMKRGEHAHRKCSGRAVERQWKCSGEAVDRQWKCSGEAVEMQRRGSGKAVEMQRIVIGKVVKRQRRGTSVVKSPPVSLKHSRPAAQQSHLTELARCAAGTEDIGPRGNGCSSVAPMAGHWDQDEQWTRSVTGASH